MSVEKINIFGEDEEEMGRVIDYSESGDNDNDSSESQIEPVPGLEEHKTPQKKEPELPPSMRIIPEKRKPKKPEKPN